MDSIQQKMLHRQSLAICWWYPYLLHVCIFNAWSQWWSVLKDCNMSFFGRVLEIRRNFTLLNRTKFVNLWGRLTNHCWVSGFGGLGIAPRGCGRKLSLQNMAHEKGWLGHPGLLMLTAWFLEELLALWGSYLFINFITHVRCKLAQVDWIFFWMDVWI